jgi:hypothetical protein
MKVLNISAKAQHGKDTAAEIIKEYLELNNKRVLIIHYADLLKFICKSFFGWDGNKDVKGRTLLQYVGTDVVFNKNKAYSYWVDWVVGVLKMFNNEWDCVIIPDCRYPIEVETVGNAFESYLLRVERPNFDNNLTPEQKNHSSETAMDNYSFEHIIYNDADLDSFKEKLIDFVNNSLLK